MVATPQKTPARRGRPPKSAQKKGKPSWKPATALTAQKIPGHRTRWVNKDPMNIQRKEAEGWAIVDPNQGLRSEHEHPEDLTSGKPVTSTIEYRELVLAALPEETAQARTEYFEAQTDRQTAALKQKLTDELAEGPAEVHGKITIIE